MKVVILCRKYKQLVRAIMSKEWDEVIDEMPNRFAALRKASYWAKQMDDETLWWMSNMLRIMWPYYNEVSVSPCSEAPLP